MNGLGTSETIHRQGNGVGVAGGGGRGRGAVYVVPVPVGYGPRQAYSGAPGLHLPVPLHERCIYIIDSSASQCRNPET